MSTSKNEVYIFVILGKAKTTFYRNLSQIFSLSISYKELTMDQDNIAFVGKHEMKKIMRTASFYLS